MRQRLIRRLRIPKKIKQNGIVRLRDILKTSSFPIKDEKKYFAWAKVVKAYSRSNDVDVILDIGIRLNHVAVISKEWAGSNATTSFGSRDLPPKDALVFIAFPYGTLEDGLVLGSAFTLLGKLHSDKWKSDFLIEGKERELKKITENGDTVTYDKDTGAAKLVINNAEVEITAAGAVKITPATGQAIILNGGAIGANDLPNCIFSGALHCTNVPNTVKVP